MLRYRVELTLQTTVLTRGQDVRDPLTHVSPVYTGDYPPPTPHLYTGCYCTSFTLTVLVWGHSLVVCSCTILFYNLYLFGTVHRGLLIYSYWDNP